MERALFEFLVKVIQRSSTTTAPTAAEPYLQLTLKGISVFFFYLQTLYFLFLGIVKRQVRVLTKGGAERGYIELDLLLSLRGRKEEKHISTIEHGQQPLQLAQAQGNIQSIALSLTSIFARVI